MKFKNWREFAFFFMVYATIQWFILFFISMLFYTGGTASNPDSQGYDFFSNFNSDLGRTVAYSGRSNMISCIIFTISNTFFYVALTLFFIALYHFFNEKGIEKWISLIGSVFGIVAGVGFLGAVFTPWDLYYDLHILFNSIGSLALFLLVILYAIAMYLNDDYPNQYAFVNMIYTILVVIYLIVMFTGPNITSAEGLRIQATWQKIVLIPGMLNILIQGYGAWKLEKS